MPPGFLSDIKAGRTKVLNAKIESICHRFPVNELWFLTGKGPSGELRRPKPIDENVFPAPPAKGKVPLISWVQAGGWRGIEDNFQPGMADEWISTTKTVSPNAFALRISGTSMEPDYREGDIIIVDPDSPAYSGSLVVARMNGDNEATFKKFVKDGGSVYLEPLNERYQPIDITGQDVTICGVVRQLIRDV